MALSELGQMVDSCWAELPRHFPMVVLDEWVVMPDHFHGIVSIGKHDLGGFTRLEGEACLAPTIVDASAVVDAGGVPVSIGSRGTTTTSDGPTLGAIIGSFKSASTRSIRRKLNAPDQRVWQRGYYDRVIRKAEELDRIRKYITDNPRHG